jgi:hypothetical protein
MAQGFLVRVVEKPTSITGAQNERLAHPFVGIWISVWIIPANEIFQISTHSGLEPYPYFLIRNMR